MIESDIWIERVAAGWIYTSRACGSDGTARSRTRYIYIYSRGCPSQAEETLKRK